MKNRQEYIIFTALFLSFFILQGYSQAKYSGGSGTAGDPYKIASAADLLLLAADTNDYNKSFILTTDIDLSSHGVFTTAVIAPDTNNAFTGTFDGKNHIISNLTIDTNDADNSYLGLFGLVANGWIKNLRIRADIIGGDDSWYLGGLAGYNGGDDINNCSSAGAVSGGDNSQYLGGLTGINGGIISDCHSSSSVTGGASSSYLGGLVGLNGIGFTISRCYSTGAVSASDGSSNLGGLTGYNNEGTISDCFSTGSVTAADATGLGGLAGINLDGAINNCYAAGSVTGSGSSDLGGLVGYDDSGTISSCYFLDTEPNNDLGTPLSEANMKHQSSFVGWDFANIWWIKEGISFPKLFSQLDITSCSVTAGSKSNTDKIAFSGQMYTGNLDFNDFNNVINIIIDSNDINKPCDINFPANINTFKNGKYSYSGTDGNIAKAFTYDTKTRKFASSVGKTSLLGLGCPVNIGIGIGNYLAAAEVNETIVNGPIVPIPIKLMMGAKNVLRVDKATLLQGMDPNTDILTVAGAFAVKYTDVNMNAYDLVITLGEQSFTLPQGSLKTGKQMFSCKKAPLTEGGTADITFNFKLCSFTLTIKNTEITADPGPVDFGFDFADFSESAATTLPGSGLLLGAVDYAGSYPEANTVTFTYDGQTVQIPAYPGQIVVFFQKAISDSAAQKLFASYAGTILAKISKIGYYLVGVAPGTEDTFITAVTADARVSLAVPNIVGVRGGVALLEGCGDLHHTKVKASFENNGGTDDKCRDIYTGSAYLTAFDKIVNQILKEANQNGKGPTLINLSTYGTIFDDNNIPINGDDWETYDSNAQQDFQDAWGTFMTAILKAIASLPASYRENFVLTVCSGNNNMPVCSEITRLNSKYAEILRKNVLIVSTDLMPGNHCATDPNVVVMGNTEAADGTSYAAPAALAVVQSLMKTSNISASQALQAVKRAVTANPDHNLVSSEALNQTRFTVSITKTGSGGGTVTTFPLPNGPNDTYIIGTVVTLTANPDAVSSFKSWSGDATGTSKTVKITMNGNKSVTAEFAKKSATYTGNFSGSTTDTEISCVFTHTVTGKGTVTIPSSGSATFNVGGTDRITVASGENCHGGSQSASYQSPLTVNIDGVHVSADIVNDDGTSASFTGTISDDQTTITGELTLDSSLFDSPIVGPLILTKK